MSLLDVLIAQETKVWEALVTGDRDADAAFLSEDFLGVYPDGFSDRAAHVGQLSGGPSMRSYSLSQARILELGGGQVLLAYRADYVRAGRDDTEAMYVSSIWTPTPTGAWVNIFSQDTPALSSNT